MELKLMQLRKKAGYKNRDDFARKIGIKPRTYKTWESGERNMNFDQACMVADALHVSLDELAGRTEYICQYADPRQTAINADFEKLDDPSKDSAVAAIKGMAIACAQASDPAGSKDNQEVA